MSEGFSAGAGSWYELPSLDRVKRKLRQMGIGAFHHPGLTSAAIRKNIYLQENH